MWRKGASLDIFDHFKKEWASYTSSLIATGIQLNREPDRIVWIGNQRTGLVMAKSMYDYCMSVQEPPPQASMLNRLWSGRVPTKLKCFEWLCIGLKILTWDGLQKHGHSGLSWCGLCSNSSKSVNHIFGECIFFQAIWTLIYSYFSLSLS